MRFAWMLSLLLLTGCGPLIQKMVTPADTACLVLAGSTTREISGVTRIIGSVRNDCKHSFSSVTVVLRLYRNEQQTRIGLSDPSIHGYLRNLQPGETKEFETFPVSRNAAYRFEKIIAY